MMQNRSMLGFANQMRVISLIIADTGTYNTLFRRSYVNEADVGMINSVQERIMGATHITPSMLGGVADTMIVPSATPEIDQNGNSRQIGITGGWQEERIRFELKVETTFSTGGTVIELIQGWTNFKGVTHTGAVAQDMEFHINSVMKIRNVTENTPFGVKQYSNIVDATHLLVNNDAPGLYDPNPAERIRPEDVFAGMTRSTYNDLGSFVDTRTVHNSNPVLSNRKNVIPTNYLADIMEGYQNTMTDPSTSGQGLEAIYNHARGYVQSPMLQQDPFLKAIAQIRGVVATDFFTMGDLVRLDPNTPRLTTYARSGQDDRIRMSYAGQGEYWHGASLSTRTAVILSNAVPALMMELGFVYLEFSSTNRNTGNFLQPSGKITTVVGPHNTVGAGTDMSNHLRTFVSRFDREIAAGLSKNNLIDYHVEMKVDLRGESRIWISMMGEPMAEYIYPSFADALAVPIITNDRNRAASLVDDIGNFLSTVIPSADDIMGGSMNNPYNTIYNV